MWKPMLSAMVNASPSGVNTEVIVLSAGALQIGLEWV
jgi:hypothetical protein